MGSGYMKSILLKGIIFKVLGALGVPTKSEPHLSINNFSPNEKSIPIIVLGFARTGTTTAQFFLSKAFSYNASFEPFGFNHSNLPSFGDANYYFVGNPEKTRLDEWGRQNYLPGSLNSIGDQKIKEKLENIFNSHFDSVYSSYGRNVVVKEIRLVSNLEAILNYHKKENIVPIVIGLYAHPYQPLYTYYRISALSKTNNIKNYRILDLYAYRVNLYKGMGLFEDIISLPCINASDYFLISILLDQAYLKFCYEKGALSYFVTLSELHEVIDKLKNDYNLEKQTDDKFQVTQNVKYLKDYYFSNSVLNKIHPEIKNYIDSNYDIDASFREIKAKRSFETFFTFLRFKLFCD